jgi:hypothetical protein
MPLALLLILALVGRAARTAPPSETGSPKPEKTASQFSAGEKAAAEGLTKREWKAKKRERQREQMLKRIEKKSQDGSLGNSTEASLARITESTPNLFSEDFAIRVNWDEKNDNEPNSNTRFGYSTANHLASAGCAPGEIGGAVSDHATFWYADDIAHDSASINLQTPLSASGSCVFTAVKAHANLGWFNAKTYTAAHRAPNVFIGWRQDGGTVRPALGYTGTSLVSGQPLVITENKPFQWSISYAPTGGTNACALISLTINGTTSFLSLTKEQKDALAGKAVNRFGIVTAETDSQDQSTVWFDNLSYTRMSGFPVPHSKAAAHIRTAFFDTDPTGSTFFAVNNLSPHDPVTVVENYGYRPVGGRGGGCVGGQFTPAIGTSYYGYDYGDKKLHFTDKLRSEGWFQVPGYEGRCFHLGWTSKAAMSWHEPSTLALRISSVGKKGQGHFLNIAGEGTLKNHEGHGGAGWGTIVELPAGPEWHHYVMEFDPAGGYGLGTFTVQIDNTTKVFYFGENKRQEDADIDLFGMWNAKIPAEEGAITGSLDDVTNTTNGQRDPASNDFNSPPAGWVGNNNAFTKKDFIIRPFHEFGWAKTLLHLDGLDGYSSMYQIQPNQRYCMGGIIYLASFNNLHVPRASYGAGLNGSLNTQEHHMYATGRFKLDWANVDAGELFGWYNSATACDDTTGGKGNGFPNNFLGVAITGGSNGYGMIPGYRSSLLANEQSLKAWNPATHVYQDGQWREFYMEYNPDAAGGAGQLTLQIGENGAPVTFDLAKGAKGREFAFDRFGLLTMRKGGGKPHAIYFDKLTYTVAP